MLIYCVILMTINLIGSLITENREDALVTFGSFLIMLPIYGRIFGWW